MNNLSAPGVVVSIVFVQFAMAAIQVSTALSVRRLDRERLSRVGSTPTLTTDLLDNWELALGTLILLLTAIVWMTSVISTVASAISAVSGLVLIVVGVV